MRTYINPFTGNLEIVPNVTVTEAELTAALQTKADSVHTQPIASIIGLQTQLNSKQDSDPTLVAIAALEATGLINRLSDGSVTAVDPGSLGGGGGSADWANPGPIGSGVANTVEATAYFISAIQTPPVSLSAAGTVGEIRICEDAIYICVATNTWKRSPLLGAVYSPISTAYNISQSSVFSPHTGTYANLRDGDGTTGAATNQATLSWIKATLPEPEIINAIRVGGGTLGNGWGSVVTYLNGRLIQFSHDDVDWMTIGTVSGVTDSGADQFVTIPMPSISTKFLRIAHIGAPNFVSMTEFVLLR